MIYILFSLRVRESNIGKDLREAGSLLRQLLESLSEVIIKFKKKSSGMFFILFPSRLRYNNPHNDRIEEGNLLKSLKEISRVCSFVNSRNK